MPKNLSEWAVFVPSDDILHPYTLPQAKQRGFNKSTISKPVRNFLLRIIYTSILMFQLLSFYYLDMFVRLLREYGYNHLSIPVLSFMRLIGQVLLQNSSIRTYALLRYIF